MKVVPSRPLLTAGKVGRVRWRVVGKEAVGRVGNGPRTVMGGRHVACVQCSVPANQKWSAPRSTGGNRVEERGAAGSAHRWVVGWEGGNAREGMCAKSL